MTDLAVIAFGLGFLGLAPFIVFCAAFRMTAARWDGAWLARQRERHAERFVEFVDSFDRLAARLRRIAWWTGVVATLIVLTTAGYVVIAFLLGVLPRLRGEIMLLVAFVWLFVAPVLGLHCLAASFAAGGQRIHRLLA